MVGPVLFTYPAVKKLKVRLFSCRLLLGFRDFLNAPFPSAGPSDRGLVLGQTLGTDHLHHIPPKCLKTTLHYSWGPPNPPNGQGGLQMDKGSGPPNPPNGQGGWPVLNSSQTSCALVNLTDNPSMGSHNSTPTQPTLVLITQH